MNKDEKCCGNCCWFCNEETDGWGQCMQQETWELMHCSDLCTTDGYVSRRQMRHHMAVLLQWKRYMSDRSELTLYHPPLITDRNKAMEFAYKYMKVISKS